MGKKVTVANLIFTVGGLVTILFSFFKFISYDGYGKGAWGSGNFPVATIPAILGLAALVVGVLELVGTKLPDKVLTFDWKQIKVTWGITAAAIMLAFLILDKGDGGLGVGGWFMLLGSLAMAVGAILGILGLGANTVTLPGGPAGTPGTPPPPPYGGQPYGGQQPPYGGGTPPPPPPPPPPPAG